MYNSNYKGHTKKSETVDSASAVKETERCTCSGRWYQRDVVVISKRARKQGDWDGSYHGCHMHHFTETESNIQESSTWYAVQRGYFPASKRPTSCGCRVQRFVALISMGSSGTSPFNRDLSVCDYYVFGPLKKSLNKRRFPSNNEGRSTGEDWLCSHPIFSSLKVFTISQTTGTHILTFTAITSSHYVPYVSLFILYTLIPLNHSSNRQQSRIHLGDTYTINKRKYTRLRKTQTLYPSIIEKKNMLHSI